MRKFFCVLLCIVCCVMIACSDNGNPTKVDSTAEIFIDPEIELFSWSADEEKYRAENLGVDVRFEGFKNTIKSAITQKEDAIEAAKNEIEKEYDSINVSYDKKNGMWRVRFSRIDVEGGDQWVYIDKNGLTKLIMYNE